MPESREVLRLEDLRKSYNIGQPNEVEVLHGIDLRLDSADFAALVGPSGSGKSTLLNLIGLLDSPPPASCTWTGSRPAPWTTRHAPRCAGATSASCSSSTT
jgi:ABC-type antimicrobial peptide transport system, ATPase component